MPVEKNKVSTYRNAANRETLAAKRRKYRQGQEQLRRTAIEARVHHRNPPRVWVYDPIEAFRASKEKVPEDIKRHVQKEADAWIESSLKPAHIEKPPRKGVQVNYLIDIFTKWHGPFFYFYAKYACPGPSARAPFFETPFARLQYALKAGFNLAFHRYTGEWVELEQLVSLKRCLSEIEDNGFFLPSKAGYFKHPYD